MVGSFPWYLLYLPIKHKVMKSSLTLILALFTFTSLFSQTVCTVNIVYSKNNTTPVGYTFKTDPINTAAKYYWTFGDNTVSDSPSPTHVFSKADTYQVQVKVTGTDGKGCYGELKVQFEGGTATTPVTLTAKGKVKKIVSTDGCGLLITLDNGTVIVPVEMAMAFEFKNEQYVELVYELLKDKPSGCTSGVSAKIIKIYDITPSAVCTVKIVSTKNTTTPVGYTFKTDPQTTGAKYYWTFGDNTVSDSPSPTHVFSKADTYQVQVKVTGTDGKGCYGELKIQFEGSTAATPVTLTGKGKVTSLASVTGCGLVITLENGTRLIPAKIATDFKIKEGQYVEFTYEKYAEKVTTCKEGMDVKIISIKEIAASLPNCKSPINLTLFDPTDKKCNGSAIVKLLDETGKEITNVKYAWSDGRTGSSVGNLCPATLYTVQATIENACQKNTSFTLLAKPMWNTSTINGQNNFTVIAPVEGVQYEWNFGNGVIMTGTSVNYNFQMDGIYDVTLKAVSMSGTSQFSQPIVVSQNVAKTDLNETSAIEIYPNPAKEILRVGFKNSTEGNLTFEIKNMAGQVVYKNQMNNDGSSQADINIQNLKAGMYVLRISGDQDIIGDGKFIKVN